MTLISYIYSYYAYYPLKSAIVILLSNFFLETHSSIRPWLSIPTEIIE